MKVHEITLGKESEFLVLLVKAVLISNGIELPAEVTVTTPKGTRTMHIR